jgi:hypothetical protein
MDGRTGGSSDRTVYRDACARLKNLLVDFPLPELPAKMLEIKRILSAMIHYQILHKQRRYYLPSERRTKLKIIGNFFRQIHIVCWLC